MKNFTFCLAALMAALLFLLAPSCGNPDMVPEETGELAIRLSGEIAGSKTILPALDMTVASFDINGIGPGSESFTLTGSMLEVQVDNLVFGEWTVTVDARNSAGTVIASGIGTGTVKTGETTFIQVDVEVPSGNGNFDLSLQWNATDVGLPTVTGELVPASGTSIPLSFALNGSTATAAPETVPSGYYTLKTQLYDNAVPVMGRVEIVRVLKDQNTAGNYTFSSVNNPGGSVMVNINPVMNEPLDVTILGGAPEMNIDETWNLSYSVTGGGVNYIPVWYLNGVSLSTAETLTLQDMSEGHYFVDLTVFTADGNQAGSASLEFDVVQKILTLTYKQNYNMTVPGIINNDPRPIYASGNTILAGFEPGISISTNAGAAWTGLQEAEGFFSNDIVGVGIIEGTMIAASDGAGVAISADNGLTWENITSTKVFAENSCDDMFIDGTKLYVVAGSKIYITDDLGDTQQSITSLNGLKTSAIDDIAACGNVMVVGYWSSGIAISTDSGTTWNLYTTDEGLPGNMIYDVFTDGQDIYAGTNMGIAVTHDAGASFTNNSLHPTGSASTKTVSGSLGRIYAGTDNSGFHYSEDRGMTWTKVDPYSLVNTRWVESLFADNGTLYVGMNGSDTYGGILVYNWE